MCNTEYISLKDMFNIIKEQTIYKNRNKIYRWLCAEGYLVYYVNKAYLPSQHSIDSGWMDINVVSKFSKKRKKIDYKSTIVSPSGVKYFLELFKTDNFGKGISLIQTVLEEDMKSNRVVKNNVRRCHTCGGPSKGQYWCWKCKSKRMGEEISDRVDGDFIYA